MIPMVPSGRAVCDHVGSSAQHTLESGQLGFAKATVKARGSEGLDGEGTGGTGLLC